MANEPCLPVRLTAWQNAQLKLKFEQNLRQHSKKGKKNASASRWENMAKLYANYAAWRGEQPSSHSKLPVKFCLTSFWPNQIAEEPRAQPSMPPKA